MQGRDTRVLRLGVSGAQASLRSGPRRARVCEPG